MLHGTHGVRTVYTTKREYLSLIKKVLDQGMEVLPVQRNPSSWPTVFIIFKDYCMLHSTDGVRTMYTAKREYSLLIRLWIRAD